MPFADGQSLLIIFIVLLGCGLFLRMVAKEKRRRERYLEVRLMEKRQAELDRQQRAAERDAREATTVVTPADLSSARNTAP